MCAAENGYTEIAALLLANGANVNAKYVWLYSHARCGRLVEAKTWWICSWLIRPIITYKTQPQMVI